ncbi:hypothetical protein SEVIR_9G117202v4 [Setaria viridis]
MLLACYSSPKPSRSSRWCSEVSSTAAEGWRRVAVATAEDLARNRPVVLSLYRQILRALNSPELPLGHATRLAKKAECRATFIFGAEERSIHNIRDLLDAARHTLGLLNHGRLVFP